MHPWLKKLKLKEALTYNIWLKLLALGVAILIWLFVSSAIVKGIRI